MRLFLPSLSHPRLCREALSAVSTGHIVNLISNDVERFTETPIMSHFLWIAPAQTLVVAYLIWQQIGVSTLSGMSLMLVLVPLHPLFGRFYASFRNKTATATDSRVKTVKEAFVGMRILKMYNWETPFTEKVDAVRKVELQSLVKSNQIRGFNISFNFMAGPLMAFLCFVTYEFLGNVLTAEKVFSSIGYLNTLRHTMALFFPMGIQVRSRRPHTCRGSAR